MVLVNLFLWLFRLIVRYCAHKDELFAPTALIWLDNQRYRRYFEQHNIKPPFLPHEKQAVYEFYRHAKNPAHFFNSVSPQTVLKLWKNAVARFWTHPHKKRGKPPLTKKIRELIKKLKTENYLWGARRIRDELHTLSIEVSHETICRILKTCHKNGDFTPNFSWRKFLSAHWESLYACDFFTVTAWGFTTFYVFFIIELKSRKIVHYNVVQKPSIQFLRLQLSDFEYRYPNAYLIHDNSGELKWFPYHEYSFKSVPITPHSPDMNAYAERFVRSVRQECLDHFIVISETQLRRIMKEYISYYNNYRPHQGLKSIPNGMPESGNTGKIRREDVLFGLHHHYYREAG